MTFRADTLRGFPARPSAGQVDFRLARRAVLADFRKGRLSRLDVCDAHPELIRAAINCGRPATEPCPVCEEESLTLVTYVFGPRLPPNGRCVTSTAELAKLDRSPRDLTAYVVEVCPDCSWNHLSRTYRMGRSRPA